MCTENSVLKQQMGRPNCIMFMHEVKVMLFIFASKKHEDVVFLGKKKKNLTHLLLLSFWCLLRLKFFLSLLNDRPLWHQPVEVFQHSHMHYFFSARCSRVFFYVQPVHIPTQNVCVGLKAGLSHPHSLTIHFCILRHVLMELVSCSR